MRILLLGDYFIPEGALPPMGEELRALMGRCDEVVVNFEGPIRPGPSARPAFKTGPNLHQAPAALAHLRDCGVTSVSLANNHAHDFGAEGLEATVRAAEAAGLKVAGLGYGAGPVPVISAGDDVRIATLAFAEEEWCGPRDGRPHICLLDIVDMARAVKAARETADAVVVILHGGAEHHAAPPPGLMKTARFVIECGAAAVAVHHAHVVAGMEIHEGRPIFYGLGNFQFAKASTKPRWREGLGVLLDISRCARGDVEVTATGIPISTAPDTYCADIVCGDLALQMTREFAARSRMLESEASVRAAFDDFVERNDDLYGEMLNPFATANRVWRLLGRLWVRAVWLPRRRAAILLNSYRCPSHREAMIRYLERRL